MGGRALSLAPEETDMSHRRTEGSRVESPAIRLLDALRHGDDAGVLAVCGDTTVVHAENMRWSCQGRDEIHRWLVEAREHFPGLTFESHTRHMGFGLVIDEARVQDVQAGPELPDEGDEPDGADHTVTGAAHLADVSALAGEPVDAQPETGADHSAVELSSHRADVPAIAPSDHPMWDQPATERRNVMRLWRERAQEAQPATALNMPVRVTVRHDDLQVHEVSLSFPAALFKRALGMKVDPFEMSLSEVQSAFIAPVGAGFTSYALDRPELTLVAPPPVDEPEPEPAAAEPPRRRRRGRVLLPLLLILALLAAGGAWWATQMRDTSANAGPTTTPTTTPSAALSPSASPSAVTSSKPATQPSQRPSGKPDFTLDSDFSFASNSAELSTQAKADLAVIASQIVDRGVTGTIYVDGYTDNVGSATYGQALSLRRAKAVATYLESKLGSADVQLVTTGHGESDPIASNATAQGRAQNRRVTITLG
jgi:outer membrane protein OmpA-like peptidoglycan-associated protein